jgi:hypothetical protein
MTDKGHRELAPSTRPEATRIAVDAPMPDWASTAFDSVEGSGAVKFDRSAVWGRYVAVRANPANPLRAVNREDFSGWLWSEKPKVERERGRAAANGAVRANLRDPRATHRPWDEDTK